MGTIRVRPALWMRTQMEAPMPDPIPTPNEGKQTSESPKNPAAQHTEAGSENAGAERYPPVSKDDSITKPGQNKDPTGERRSFEGNVESAEPREGARGADPDPSVNQGHMGPGGDPAEGKR
jgi:hypothetical protein